MINEIANLAFITDTTNKQISDKEPSVYFPAVNKAYPDALESQLITQDESLWKVDKFESFLEERRKLIARELNVFLDSIAKKKTSLLIKKQSLKDSSLPTKATHSSSRRPGATTPFKVTIKASRSKIPT